MSTSGDTDQDARVLKAAVDKGLISPALAADTQRQALLTQTAATALLIKQGVLTQHIVNNLASPSGDPQVVAGFKILGRLGQGGMGTVYRALQVSMNREVALKVIARQFAADPQFCERFLREARAAGAINHPNVITCFDVGQDREWLYMALELMTGGDASALLKAHGGRLPEERALRLIADCARGLSALRRAGLIHRDIKPANIFISQDGVAKLADLGLARSTSGDDRMTMTGAAMGTPAFMSPEQASGETDLDIRTDIYALGATLFSLVTGETPYKGASAFAVVAKVINDPVPDPRPLAPISEGACALLMHAMSKRREERYQHPEALVEDIERVLANRPPLLSVAFAGPSSQLATVMTPPRGSTPVTPTSPTRGRPATRATSPAAGAGARSMDQPTMFTSPPEPATGPAPASSSGTATMLIAAAALALVLGLGCYFALRAPRSHAGDTAPSAAAPAGVRNDGPIGTDVAQSNPAISPPGDASTPGTSRNGGNLDQPLALTTRDNAQSGPAATIAPLPDEHPSAPPAPQDTAVHGAPSPQTAPPPTVPVVEPSRPTPVAIASAPPRPRPPATMRRRPMRRLPEVTAPATLASYRRMIADRGVEAELADAGDGTVSAELSPNAKTLDGFSGIPISRLECVGDEHITSLAPLEGLPLRSLSLRDCRSLADLSPLASSSIEVLDLTGCEAIAGDLQALRDLPLHEIHLGACHNLSSLNGLQGARLNTLDLTDCRRLSTLAELSGVPLTHLSLVRCPRITALDGAVGMPLQHVEVIACDGLESIKALTGAPLVTLTLESCRHLRTLEGLEGSSVHELMLRDCEGIATLTGLKGSSLTHLTVEKCASLVSLDGLQGVPLDSIELTECSSLPGDLEPLMGDPVQQVTLRACPHLTGLHGLERSPLRRVVVVECRRLLFLRPARRPGVELIAPGRELGRD